MDSAIENKSISQHEQKAENLNTTNSHRNRVYIKVGLFLIAAVTVAAVLLWAKSVIETYNNAKRYKKSYDIVQEQFRLCSSPQVPAGEDPAAIVHYCDQFKKRFNSVKMESK